MTTTCNDVIAPAPGGRRDRGHDRESAGVAPLLSQRLARRIGRINLDFGAARAAGDEAARAAAIRRVKNLTPLYLEARELEGRASA